MLAIRMQRQGRKGHPTYRVVVQDSRRTPTSGKVVAMLGSYDPHTKTNTLVKDKAQIFLDNGAQPSERVVQLFVSEGMKLPKWVKQSSKQSREIRHSDKLRRNRPAGTEAVADKPSEEKIPETAAEEAPETEAVEAPAAEAVATDAAAPEATEAPAEVTSEPDAPADAAAVETAEEPASETETVESKDDDSEPDEATAPGSDEFPEDSEATAESAEEAEPKEKP